MRSAIRKLLTQHGYDPERQRIRITSEKLTAWFNAATGRDEVVFNASKILGQMATEGQLPRLSKARGHKGQRGFIWTGELTAAGTPIIEFVPKSGRPSGGSGTVR